MDRINKIILKWAKWIAWICICISPFIVALDYFALGVIITIIGLVSMGLSYHRQVSIAEELDKANKIISELENENTKLQNQNIDLENKYGVAIKISEQIKKDAFESLHDFLNEYIKKKAKNHFMATQEPIEFRATIYTHNLMNNTFTQLGRYAPRKKYNGRGRTNYKIDSGAIGEAWDIGICDAKIKANPESSLAEYNSELIKEWKMSSAEVENLTMKPRHLKAQKIIGGRDGSQDIGVALVETDKHQLTKDQIDFLSLICEDNDNIIHKIMNLEYDLHRKHERPEM